MAKCTENKQQFRELAELLLETIYGWARTKKLGLTRKGANLRTCLMAIEKPLSKIPGLSV